jgi:hypothetical protein
MAKDYFLDHPTVDKVMKVVMALAQEAYITRDRLALIEKKLDENGVVYSKDLDEYDPTKEEQAIINQRRDEFVDSILKPLVD